MKKFKFIDLFAGIGGFRRALEKYGGNCVFSSELDKYCQIAYNANYGEIPFGDITKINAEDIPDHDVLCGGFPCQAFSISGKQLGFKDTRGTLFFDILRILSVKKPKIVFLENVANLAKHDESKTVNQMIFLLNDLGYKTFYNIINSSDFSVPQSRKRLFIVGFLDNSIEFSFPSPDTGKIVSVVDILEKKVDEKFFIPIELCKIDKDVWPIKTKSIQRIGTIGKGGQGNRIYSPYGQGITLSANGGGKAARTGAYLIDGKVRKLTPRECARLQGYDESFKIVVNENQAYKQFGNSVSVPVIEEIFKKIFKNL